MAKAKKRRLKHGTKATAQPRQKVRVHPAPWDMGADGPANRARDSVVMDASEPEVDVETGEIKRCNPNGVKRRVFYDMLDVYYQRGWITKRGYSAGVALRDAWERTEQGAAIDWSQDRVDSTSKPDAAIAIQIDKVSRLVGITRRIPKDDHRILMTVACEKNSIGRLPKYRGKNHERGKTHLHDALERLADALNC